MTDQRAVLTEAFRRDLNCKRWRKPLHHILRSIPHRRSLGRSRPRALLAFPSFTRSFAAVALLLSACGTSEADATPVVTFDGSDGASLFQQACAECHGTDLNGTDQGPPFLHDFYRASHHADIAFFFAIRAGAQSHHWNFGDMDPLPGLTDTQAEAIVAFIREIQRANGFS